MPPRGGGAVAGRFLGLPRACPSSDLSSCLPISLRVREPVSVSPALAAPFRLPQSIVEISEDRPVVRRASRALLHHNRLGSWTISACIRAPEGRGGGPRAGGARRSEWARRRLADGASPAVDIDGAEEDDSDRH